jgi:pSer/pThr/pTyr-binding forkhead associated (FHA) protein
VLADLGSTNGTLVNGQAITEAVVAPGDRLQLGSTRLEIVVPGEAGGR